MKQLYCAFVLSKICMSFLLIKFKEDFCRFFFRTDGFCEPTHGFTIDRSYAMSKQYILVYIAFLLELRAIVHPCKVLIYRCNFVCIILLTHD